MGLTFPKRTGVVTRAAGESPPRCVCVIDPWAACFDWDRGSAGATSQFLVAVGPAPQWNGSAILLGHVEDMMAAAKVALNEQARSATGVGLGFAAADDWLAAQLANPVLVNRVMMAESAWEYEEPMRLMSEDGWKWVQIGSSDWEDNSGFVMDSAMGKCPVPGLLPRGECNVRCGGGSGIGCNRSSGRGPDGQAPWVG